MRRGYSLMFVYRLYFLAGRRLRAGEGPRSQGAVTVQDGPVNPGALVDELLQGLDFILDVQPDGQGDAAAERLDALALAVSELPSEVDATYPTPRSAARLVQLHLAPTPRTPRA